MIKMVATDIDGTILNWEYGGFTQGVIDCVKKLTASNVKVVLVTGRMHKSATFLADELGLDTPIVSYQGGMIKENKENGECYYRKNLDNEKAKEIIKWARENNIHINLYINDVLYVENDNEIIKKYTGARYIEYKVCNFDDLTIDNINKILAIDYNNPEKVTNWVEFLSKKYPDLYIVKSTPYFCEISHKDARKSCAVEYLRKKWNLKKEEVLTIGDQNNDIELLKAGGIKVAMGNGTPELKECADFITDTVQNDGFVKAVEKFIFHQER
ncbi:HAD family phosphatase [bacterium]|nr:HAD family phosphatase [bacterium]